MKLGKNGIVFLGLAAVGTRQDFQDAAGHMEWALPRLYALTSVMLREADEMDK